MIVCSCNVLTERDVRDRLANASHQPRNVAEAYRCCGKAPICGRCAPTLREIMRNIAPNPAVAAIADGRGDQQHRAA